jgi:hypothetical protein
MGKDQTVDRDSGTNTTFVESPPSYRLDRRESQAAYCVRVRELSLKAIPVKVDSIKEGASTA